MAPFMPINTPHTRDMQNTLAWSVDDLFPGAKATRIRMMDPPAPLLTTAQELKAERAQREPVKRDSHVLRLDRMTNYEAVLVQIMGTMNSWPCGNCSKGNGLFVLCVLRPGVFNESCANCHYNSLGKCCSLQGCK